MTVKVVIFDLFETLISEFDSGHPSTTEVAQTLQLPVEGISAGIPESSIRTTVRDSSQVMRRFLRYIIRKLGGKSAESTIKTLTDRRHSAFADASASYRTRNPQYA